MPFLPLRNRVMFSASALGSEALAQSRNIWLLYLYSPPDDSGREELLPLAVTTVVLFASRLVGALDDAFVCYLSDRSKSRWGRRLPYAIAGTPFWLLFAVLIFLPPRDSGDVTIAFYLLITLEMYSVASTFAGTPFEALIPEVAPTNRERVQLSALRVYFGVGGAAVGLVSSGLLKDAFGFAPMAAIMAAWALVFRVLAVAGVWNYAPRDRPPVTFTFREAMRQTFRNRQFLLFLPTFVLFQVALAMLTGVLPYYVEAIFAEDYRLQAGPIDVALGEGALTSILTAMVIGVMLCMVPLFGRLAVRRSKREAFRIALLGCTFTFPLIAFLGFLPGIPTMAQALIAMALAGAPVVGVYLFPAPLTADIADLDHATTGQRREATYFGAQSLVEKTAGSFAPLFLGGLLLLGNDAGDSLGIRLVGPAAALVTFAGYWVFRRYDLPDDLETVTPPVEQPARGRSQAG